MTSPRARLAMRTLELLLLPFCARMIWSKVTFPTIPDRKTKQDTHVFMYLKTPLTLVGPVHMGSRAGWPKPDCGPELLVLCRVEFWVGEAAPSGSSERPGTRSVILKDSNIRSAAVFCMTAA